MGFGAGSIVEQGTEIENRKANEWQKLAHDKHSGMANAKSNRQVYARVEEASRMVYLKQRWCRQAQILNYITKVSNYTMERQNKILVFILRIILLIWLNSRPLKYL
jgi:hypothetical protein